MLCVERVFLRFLKYLVIVFFDVIFVRVCLSFFGFNIFSFGYFLRNFFIYFMVNGLFIVFFLRCIVYLDVIFIYFCWV